MCTWKYKIKYNPNATIDKPKSRLLAQGFTQVEGVDYHESFSPVAKWQTIQILIHMAFVNKWPLHQIDINNAFLRGYLFEKIYMRPPPGYTKGKFGQVCKLNRTLYGLKQALKAWNHEFSNNLQAYGFVQSEYDNCVFTKSDGPSFWHWLYILMMC